MNPRAPDLSADTRRAIHAYEDRILELLEWCAEYQQHNSEVFLWNARRALEAICHLLLTVHKGIPSRVDRPSGENSLESMIKQLEKGGVLDREQEPRFQFARTHTNLGVHIQKPEREDYDAPVKDVAHVLPELVDWLYEKSLARPFLRACPSELLAVIRNGGQDGLPPKQAADAARHAQLQAEEKAVRVERALQEKERRLEEVTGALHARKTGRLRWIGRLALAGAAALVLGVCTGGAGASLLPDLASAELADILAAPAPLQTPKKPASPTLPSQSEPSAPPPAPGAVAAVPAPAPPSVTTSAGASIPPASGNVFPELAPPPTAAKLSCPPGMLLVPETKGMLLGQPIGGRQNWPKADRRPFAPTDVPAFCLDSKPRTRKLVSPSRYDVAGVDACERNVPRPDRPPERTCLTRDEAERICAADVSNGHLASILEWEAAARADLRGLELPSHEWSGERFPPAVLHRADPTWANGDGMWVGQISEARRPESERGNVLLAWNQQPPEKRSEERGFRCASAPVR